MPLWAMPPDPHIGLWNRVITGAPLNKIPGYATIYSNMIVTVLFSNAKSLESTVSHASKL